MNAKEAGDAKLECWNDGTMECWNAGRRGWTKDGVPERPDGGGVIENWSKKANNRAALIHATTTSVLAAVVGLLLTVGCRPSANKSDGVELVLSSQTTAPAMTFELRFEEPIVKSDQVGLASDSPLIIAPAIAGSFTWLSARSGIFTPTQALALNERYELRLRRGLTRADGKPCKAELCWTLTTPSLSLHAFSPRATTSELSCEPEVKLVFNGYVDARRAAPFISFRDATGQNVAAKVRQGTVEEKSNYEFGWGVSLRTWLEEFAYSRLERKQEPAEASATNQVANFIIATPRYPLPIGTGWKLVVSAGLPGTDSSLRLRDRSEIALGEVTPFQVKAVTAQHWVVSGPRIRVEFSKPVSHELTNHLGQWLILKPAPTNLSTEIYGASVVLNGAFQGGTTYHLKLDPTLLAIEPFRLTGSNTFELFMPHVAPRLYFPAFSNDQLAGGNRRFTLLAVNVPRARVRAKLLEPQTALHALRGYGGYYRNYREPNMKGWDEPYQPLNYDLVAGHTVFNQELRATTTLDEAKTVELEWDQLLPGRKTGVVFLEARRTTEDDNQPSLGTQALIQLTDLGLLWKQFQNGLDAFVFSQATGEPVTGATARLLNDENESCAEAVSDASGLLHFVSRSNATWIATQLGEDFHALPLKGNRLRLYSFDLPYSADEEAERTRRVLLFSERNVYRPGEQLHLKALVREWGERGLVIPSGLSATMQCLDPRGRQFFQTNVAFGASGAWSLSLGLPTGPRGEYVARLCLGTNDCHDYRFEVQEFQPNAFELALQSKSVFSAEDQIEIPLIARYYFGKPLSRAQVHWYVEAQDTEFKPERFETFNFRRCETEARLGKGCASISFSGQGTLNGTSNFVIQPEIELNAVAPQPRLVSLLAEVTDVNQQTISRRVQFLKHSSDFYIGIKAPGELLEAGKEVSFEALVLGSDAQPWPETVTARLTLKRIDWESVRVQGAGRTVRYHNEAVVTNVLEQQIQLQPVQLSDQTRDEVHGQRLAGLPPLPPGEYLLELQAKDAAGRAVASSISFTIFAPAEMSWNYRNDLHLALKADQELYAPGQTAEILVQAPFSGSAFVTIEREKVLRSFVTRLEGNAPVVRVPLETNDVPNVFVCVTLMRGAENCPRNIKEPEYRFGYCQLKVDAPDSRLDVAITPSATNYLPGQSVEIAVEIKDAHGQLVPHAEVTLYAVDEGILSLTECPVPEPHDLFYSARPLAVQSSISLPNLLPEDEDELRFENKGYLGGGGGGERVRKNFLACAYWNAALATDGEGKLSAVFPAPDSLTRYRVVAVAHHGSTRFGSAHSIFRVSKPLLIEPALPQFANIGDELFARAVVQNQTDQTGDILVNLQLDDKAIPAQAEQSLTRHASIAANGSAVVEFPIKFHEAGMAKWIWKARFVESQVARNFSDAVESHIEVGHPVPLLHEVVLARVPNFSTNLFASANPQLLAGRGSFTLTIANTRLNELGDTVRELLLYPYGCVEQTSSRLIPWIVLRDLTNIFYLLNTGTNDPERAIRSGIARLFSMQTESGGLGYWPGAREPMLWASAYGGLVLAMAHQHGIELPKEEFDSLLKYLSKQLRSLSGESPDLSDHALALYTLALAGRAEPAYHEKLYALRERLPNEDRALLALAISESKGPPEMTAQLLSSHSRPARRQEDNFGSDARERAIRLLAWTSFRPDDPKVDTLVNELMRDQQQGHWLTTQGDAWALLALTEYAKRVEGKLKPADGQLVWDSSLTSFHLDERTNVFNMTFSFTNADALPLMFSNSSTNVLYTRLSIEARPPSARQPAQSRGFSLQRRYQRLDDDNQPQELHDLQVGDRVLVTVRVSVSHNCRYVVIDDALPAILEALNPEFRTQESRPTGTLTSGYWPGDFREIRKDRCLYFANNVAAGNYTLSYLARVRAAGTVTAPSAKVEQMYHPEVYGLAETQIVSSQPMK